MKQGWVLRPLGDVCGVVAGQSPEGRFYNSSGDGMPFYQGKKDFGPRYLQPPSKWTTQVTKVAERGEILMSVRAPVGPVNIAPERICIGRGLSAIAPSPAINRDFLYLQLQALERAISGSEGAVFPSISKRQIEAIPLVVPPLAEQERIVRILDDALGHLDAARLLTLNAANLAANLLDSYVRELLAGRGSAWPNLPVDDIAERCLGKMLDKAKNRGDLQPYLRNQNVRWFGFDLDDVLAMRFLPEERDRYTARRGDVLVCEGGYPGRAAVWDREDPIYFQKAVHRVRFANPGMAEWFVNYLHYCDNEGLLRGHFTGTGIQHFTGQALGKFKVPTPPTSDLAQITDELRSIRRSSDDLTLTQSSKIEAVGELRASLLHQAFTGQL